MIKRNSSIHLVVVLILITTAFTYKNGILEFVKQIPYIAYMAESVFRITITVLITDIIHQIIVLFYRSELVGRRDNFLYGIGHIKKVLFALYAGLLLLAILNISLEKALTTLSLLAAAIVLIAKDYISNFINGMYMTFARVVNIGDEVSIGAHKGKIQDITLSSVHLLNEDDDLIYIPNSVVFSSDIVNYTRREIKKTSLDFEIDVLAVKDVVEFESEIIEGMKEFHSNIKPGSYNLKVVHITSEHIKFKFQFLVIEGTDKELERLIKRRTIRHIVKLVNERTEKAIG
jgi:small-conductance mechanosensitive channel